ncbi:tetratricopeptide repeat protein [Flavobacterium sp. ZS1P14]|uniref:tetratricopeptide repeat protein n=1 Tax=Flavobacterium sp. ZS1P14 TaxID=3401729 RepID=UPI003AB090E6
MDKVKHISLSQLGLYNPQRLDDKTVESLFVVRQKYFQLLIDKINKEKPGSIPQHYLFIGQRGMGKSTLLKRLEVELRKDNSKFIPLLFPEEQYNLNKLSEFWLNSLDAMADVLEVLKKKDEVRLIDSKVKELENIKDEEDLAKQAFQFLIQISKKINKRAVLLIDNMSFIFDRLDKNEQHTLRAWLMQNDAPILVGASAVEIEETYNYGAPFYDAFQISYLNKLSFEELLEVLNNLAKVTNAEEILKDIHEEIARLKTIHQLTGGNPRTAVILFKIIIKGFSKEINDDLEALLDEITPLYKARFEELSVQMQIIVDAVALHWDPMNLAQLRTETRLENNQLSPQLKRLVELGWIEKLDAYKAKGSAYQISERFFNIWFLMRRSSRRQKKELYCLSKFLETFYRDDLHTVAMNSLLRESRSLNHITLNFGMAEVVKDKNLKKQLKDKCHKDLRDEVKENPSIYEQFGLENDVNVDNQKNQEYINIEKHLLEEIGKNEKNFEAWFNLANIYQILNKNLQSKNAYLKTIELNDKIGAAWNNLGNLYWHEFLLNDKAEEAYLKAIEIDKTCTNSLFNLALFCHSELKKYEEAEKLYLSVVELDANDSEAWGNLGVLYMLNLHNYDKAKKAYLKAIELNPNNSAVWNVLGNLYQDHLQDYEKAEKAYKKAIELQLDSNMPKYNLVFLYRDKMNKLAEAHEYFSKLEIDEMTADSYWLNKTLFELYKRNEGIAKEDLEKAFNKVEQSLPVSTQDDWWRFGAVVIKLGYGNWFLSILEAKGLETVLAPYYVAIKALSERDIEAYLNSRAVEIREPARKIMEIMEKY